MDPAASPTRSSTTTEAMEKIMTELMVRKEQEKKGKKKVMSKEETKLSKTDRQRLRRQRQRAGRAEKKNEESKEKKAMVLKDTEDGKGGDQAEVYNLGTNIPMRRNLATRVEVQLGDGASVAMENDALKQKLRRSDGCADGEEISCVGRNKSVAQDDEGEPRALDDRAGTLDAGADGGEDEKTGKGVWTAMDEDEDLLGPNGKMPKSIRTVAEQEACGICENKDAEKMLMDSGAVRHVCPGWFARSVTTESRTTAPSLRAANGAKLKYEGVKKPNFETNEANIRIGLSVVDVDKGICPVPELCDKNLEVVFRKNGGGIRNPESARKIRFPRDGRLWYELRRSSWHLWTRMVMKRKTRRKGKTSKSEGAWTTTGSPAATRSAASN